MLLDIRQIFSTYVKPVSRAFSADLSGEDFPGYRVSHPADVKINAVMEDSTLMLTLDITADVEFECARCLQECVRQFHIEKTYPIRLEDLNDPDAELLFTPEGRLDGKELAYTELVLEVPTVLLCSDDCEGLCPVCGNRKPCSCRHETSDPTDERLSILKQLLNE